MDGQTDRQQWPQEQSRTMHKRRKAAVNRFSRVNVADILRYRGRGYKSGTSRRPLSALAPGHHPLPSISARRFSRLALSGDWRRNPTARRARRGGVKFINRVLADQRRARRRSKASPPPPPPGRRGHRPTQCCRQRRPVRPPAPRVVTF